jgi:hypothetical protein
MRLPPTILCPNDGTEIFPAIDEPLGRWYVCSKCELQIVRRYDRPERRIAIDLKDGPATRKKRNA